MRRKRDVDGGWAWAVAFGVFLSFFLLGGFTRSFGLLFSEFLDMFGLSASTTSLIPAVRIACPIIVGPISTILSERYTERKVVIVGSVFISLGFVLSFFASSLDYLILTLGLIPGIGMALLISPSNVAMGKYFHKWRSRVYSLTSCGVCLGMVTVPLLLNYLIHTYSIRGTLLIFGGICLNLLITGAVQRPMPAQEEVYLAHKEDNELAEMEDNEFTQTEIVLNNTESYAAEKHLHESEVENVCQDSKTKSTASGEDKPSPVELKNHNKVGGCKNRTTTGLNRNHAIKSRQVIVFFIKDLFDPTLLKNYVYQIFLWSVTFSDITYGNHSIYFVPLIESRGIARERAAIILSIIGGCDVIGRLTAGLLADKRPIFPHHVMCVCGVITGTVCCLFPLATKFEDFVGLSVVFALVASAPTLLIMPALAHSLGVTALARGLGLGMFFRGLFAAVSAPLLGLIKDKTGSYDAIFPVIGGLQIAGGLLLLLEPVAKRRMTRDDTTIR